MTSRGSSADIARGHDFVSRVFGPAVGVPEDPVTGSAHCGIAPYWASALGKEVLTGYQASERGGEVVCSMATKGRVGLEGSAVSVTSGKYLLPLNV